MVYENPGKFRGLSLLGTSHLRDIHLSNREIPTIKLYAENVGLASVDEVMENKANYLVVLNWQTYPAAITRSLAIMVIYY